MAELREREEAALLRFEEAANIAERFVNNDETYVEPVEGGELNSLLNLQKQIRDKSELDMTEAITAMAIIFETDGGMDSSVPPTDPIGE